MVYKNNLHLLAPAIKLMSRKPKSRDVDTNRVSFFLTLLKTTFAPFSLELLMNRMLTDTSDSCSSEIFSLSCVALLNGWD